MARRIQEGDGPAVHLHLIGADVLGNAAGLAGGDRGVADGIQQRGLAVVDVAHDHDHGGAGDQILFLVFRGVDQLFFNGDHHFFFDLAAHFLGNDRGRIEVDQLGEGGHDAVFHQALDHFRAGFLHAGGQLAHADLIRDRDLDRGLFGDFQLKTAHFLRFVLPPLVGEGCVAVGAAVAELFLSAAPLLHPFAPLTAQILQPLVVLGQVHVAALAGIHDFFLGDPGHGLLGLLDRLSRLLLMLLACRLGYRLARGSRLRGRRFGCGGRLRCGRRLGRLLGGLLIGIGIDLLNAGDLVVLGQIFKYQRKLFVAQGLHVVFRCGCVLGQNVRDLLGGDPEILGNLMDSVFIQSVCTQIKPPPLF